MPQVQGSLDMEEIEEDDDLVASIEEVCEMNDEEGQEIVQDEVQIPRNSDNMNAKNQQVINPHNPER